MKQNSKFLNFMEKEKEERRIQRLRAMVTFALVINAIFAISAIIVYVKGWRNERGPQNGTNYIKLKQTRI